MTPSFFFQWCLASSSSLFNIQNDEGCHRHRHKSIISVIWRHLASSSSSFNIQNEVGHHRHRHKSVINCHFKVWWRQAVTSFWRHLASSNHHFYPSHHWCLPLTGRSLFNIIVLCRSLCIYAIPITCNWKTCSLGISDTPWNIRWDLKLSNFFLLKRNHVSNQRDSCDDNLKQDRWQFKRFTDNKYLQIIWP